MGNNDNENRKKRRKMILFFILFLFLVCTCIFCVYRNYFVKEYSAKELIKQYKKFEQQIEEEKSDMTKTEIENDLEEIKKDLMKDLGLPAGKEIIVRGKVLRVVSRSSENEERFEVHLTDNIVEENELQDYIICFIKGDEKCVFLEKGENVLIKGTFSENDVYLSDCEVVSPTIAIKEFENNINTVFNDMNLTVGYYNSKEYIVYGKVVNMYEIKEEKQKNDFNNKYGFVDMATHNDFETEVKNYNYAYILGDDIENKFVIVFANNKYNIDDKLRVMCELKNYERKDTGKMVVYSDMIWGNIYLYDE